MIKQFFKLKNDRYRENRGGYSRFLNIFCDSCGGHVALYQKDGPGELKRMYLDRILAPQIKKKDNKDFQCAGCQKVIGTFYNYTKENRSAIRLYQGSVTKKVSLGVYPLK